MHVHIISDHPNKISNLRPLLGSEYRVSSASLDGENIVPVECYATIVAADLRIVHNIAVLKGIFLKYRNVPRRIFLIDHRARLFPAQAYALGATHVLFNPVAQRDLLKVMAEAGEAPLECAQPVSRATASVGAVVLASMFSAVLTGQSTM
jgi:DNA-binding NarL/FixJ family response regulator